jgi:hypothetical protein
LFVVGPPVRINTAEAAYKFPPAFRAYLCGLLYHDRMPAVIAQENIDRWLRGEMEKNELHAARDATFRERNVSKRMNRTGAGDDDPTIIEDEEVT